MDRENKHTLTVFLKQWGKKTHCNVSSFCGAAVEAACFTLFHQREEKNPREETSVKPRQNEKNKII